MGIELKGGDFYEEGFNQRLSKRHVIEALRQMETSLREARVTIAEQGEELAAAKNRLQHQINTAKQQVEEIERLRGQIRCGYEHYSIFCSKCGWMPPASPFEPAETGEGEPIIIPAPIDYTLIPEEHAGKWVLIRKTADGQEVIAADEDLEKVLEGHRDDPDHILTQFPLVGR